MMETETIGICDECQAITDGYIYEIEAPCFNSPGENGAVCECGCREFAPLENKWSTYEIEQLMLVYRELEDSSEYEDRLKAEGFIKALEVLI